MLYRNKEVILPETLELLHDLMEDEALADFFLVGGTALALQIGHRFSVDLELFTLHPFDNQALAAHLAVLTIVRSAPFPRILFWR